MLLKGVFKMGGGAVRLPWVTVEVFFLGGFAKAKCFIRCSLGIFSLVLKAKALISS